MLPNPLFGEYPCKVDSQGRFPFPPGLLNQLPTTMRKEFVIARGWEQCLNLYPQTLWIETLKRIHEKSPYNEEQRTFARLFQSGATALTLDNQRRLLIPKRLKAYAQIEKEITLIGMGNRIEIWNTALYEQWLKKHADRFNELSQKVMSHENPALS